MRRKKYFSITILHILILFLSVNYPIADSSSTKIELAIDDPYMYINGEQYEIDPGRGTYPVIVNSRTLLPIRAIVENLGGTIEWDEAEKRVSIDYMNKLIELWVDKDIISINEKQEQIDQPPVIINSRTMVPVRFVAENMGCEVIWHEEGKRVEIIKEEVIIVEDEEFYDKERPMFRGNLKHTGVYDTKGVHEGNEIKWKFESDNNQPLVSSSPIIYRNIIFVGCYDGNLYAIDIATREKKWKFKTEGSIDSTVAIENDIVYFGSLDGNLYAVDVETGEEKWRFETGDEIRSSPVVCSGSVYFGSNDGNLYAVDAETGEEKWRFKTNYKIYSSPSIYKDTIYFGSNDGNLYAVDIETGEEKWRFKTNGGVYSSPSIYKDTIYFGSFDGNLYAVDVETGEEKWRFKTNDIIMGSPAAYKDSVYIGSFDGSLYAVDAETGNEKWRFTAEVVWDLKFMTIDTDDRFINIHTPPSIAEDTVYFGSYNYMFYAVDVNTGKEKWRIETWSPLWCSPLVKDGVVYYTSNRFLFAITDKKPVEPWIDWN